MTGLTAASHEPTAVGATDERWTVLFAMPNLVPPEERWAQPTDPSSPNLLDAGITLGSARVAIAGAADSRVVAAVSHDPNVALLLGAFSDEYGNALRPCVLIARLAPEERVSLESLIAFRNSVAMSVVLRSRALLIAGHLNPELSWSDYFDFHPARVGGHGIVTESPAQLSYMGDDARYRAMPSPYASARPTRIRTDAYLYRALGAEWRRMYEGRSRASRYGRALFRSLELAYVASSTPTRHGGSIYEWGVQAGLWVSALETLAAGAYEPNSANEGRVLDLIEEYQWGTYERRLSAKRRVAHRGRRTKRGQQPPRRINAVQDLCHRLYGARNAFLHGNSISKRLIWPWGQTPAYQEGPPSIFGAAPLAYAIALRAYLSRRHRPMTDWRLAKRYYEAMDHTEYSDAVRAIFGFESEVRTGVSFSFSAASIPDNGAVQEA